MVKMLKSVLNYFDLECMVLNYAKKIILLGIRKCFAFETQRTCEDV